MKKNKMHVVSQFFSKVVATAAVFAAVALSVPASAATAVTDYSNESAAQKEARLEWFRNAKFGMFIHWGVYSVPAGVYKDQTGHGEWYLEHTKMPVSEYEKFVPQFNPVKFDAKAWVKVAKDAGVRYIVITSKHHDGFGMFPSKLTDWCISSTPFKRDPLKELAAACKDAGIVFCLYYSIMDWHSPLYEPRRDWNDKATGKPDMDKYCDYMNGQIAELLHHYGPIGLIWFDGQWEKTWTTERSKVLYNYCRTLQPSIIINDRCGNGYGDYGTPEQTIPGLVTSSKPWESCMTMNDHWGFNKADHNWKSVQQLAHNLIDCCSKGGNYLLNVGPTAEGEIPQPSIERMEAIGKWLSVNKEAIFGTTAGPFRKLPWGRCTQKESRKSTTLYLHVFDWPKDGKLLLPGLKTAVKKGYLLADPKKTVLASSQSSEDGIVLDVPAKALDDISTAVVVVLKGKPEFQDYVTKQSADGSIVVEAIDVLAHGNELKAETKEGKNNIGSWMNESDNVEWLIRVDKPGKFAVTAEVATPGNADCEFMIGGQSWKFTVEKTGSHDKFETRKLGLVTIPEAGKFSLQVKPVKGKWCPVNLRTLSLKPE